MSNRRKNQKCLSDEDVERLLRKLSEENFEAFRAEWEKLLPNSQEEDDKKLNCRETERIFHYIAGLKLIAVTGNREKGLEAFLVAGLYQQFDPQDAIESVLAQTIVALTDTTMGCARRASVADALPVRTLELTCATRCALILPQLTKAFDSYREGKQKRNRGPHGQ